MTATDRQHTFLSIAEEAKTTKRTVQRWLSKAGDIGELRGDTRYFSDAERDTLLSYQSKRQTTDTSPDTPVTQGNIPCGMGKSTDFRLFPVAP